MAGRYISWAERKSSTFTGRSPASCPWLACDGVSIPVGITLDGNGRCVKHLIADDEGYCMAMARRQECKMLWLGSGAMFYSDSESDNAEVRIVFWSGEQVKHPFFSLINFI